MKIRKLKYNNHKILGNLELDFVNPATDQTLQYYCISGRKWNW